MRFSFFIRTIIEFFLAVGFVFQASAQSISIVYDQPQENVATSQMIDRYALITRHNPVLHKADPFSPFTVGNGGFAFTADITGLQTFPDYYYTNGIPLEMLSDWCWHSFPNSKGYTLADASRHYRVNGKDVLFPTEQASAAGRWLRINPHRLPLGRIGFHLKKKDGTSVSLEEISDVSQTLDMWTGMIKSVFTIDGEIVNVETLCHPDLDLIAVEVRSALIQSGQIEIVIEFPYTHNYEIKNKPPLDWSKPDKHHTIVEKNFSQRADLKRIVDSTVYFVSVGWEGQCGFYEKAKHKFAIVPSGKSTLLRVRFAFLNDRMESEMPTVEETRRASAEAWKYYWMKGGVVDFSGSIDPRAFELERRVILSQYLIRTQSCGSFPPQESGLMFNSWYGKHHTEMIWWHTAHFALWYHPELLEKNLLWYVSNLPVARQTAKDRGLEGARWSKMVGPDGRESPGINPFIIWNQPHPIFLAFLLYRFNNNEETLAKWKNLVLESADCMASMVMWDSTKNKFVLGPPLWHAQETNDPLTSQNPTFELSYWSYGLRIAQGWLKLLGLERNEKWHHIVQNLSPLPTREGLYVGLESSPTTFTEPENERDHPSMLMPFGFLPGTMVDTATMHRTLRRVVATWHWEDKIWGWDYPMMAMTATRLRDPELAVDILLKERPGNYYARNGHCVQAPDLPAYLPANGALLSAIALMTGGWVGAGTETPGFPKNGKWNIKYENLYKLP